MNEPEVKVTINQAPAQSDDPHAIDAKGRYLKLAEPDVLLPYQLVKIVGAEAAENRVYMSMVFPLLYLSAIDNEPVFPPISERELQATIQRLGHDGVRALRAGVEKYFGNKDKDQEAAAVKN